MALLCVCHFAILTVLTRVCFVYVSIHGMTTYITIVLIILFSGGLLMSTIHHYQ